MFAKLKPMEGKEYCLVQLELGTEQLFAVKQSRIKLLRS